MHSNKGVNMCVNAAKTPIAHLANCWTIQLLLHKFLHIVHLSACCIGKKSTHLKPIQHLTISIDILPTMHVRICLVYLFECVCVCVYVAFSLRILVLNHFSAFHYHKVRRSAAWNYCLISWQPTNLWVNIVSQTEQNNKFHSSIYNKVGNNTTPPPLACLLDRIESEHGT